MRMTESETCPHCGKNVNYAGSTAHLPAGYVVSGKQPYVLGAALGQGGFGITYIALDMVTGERVAIKEYYPTYCSVRSNAATVAPYTNQEEVYVKGKERFLDEARTLNSLSDLKSIVNVLDFFEANNTAYLVMEYLEGMSLKEYAAKNGTFPAQQFLEQIKPLMKDIHRMHERGVIHRDIAPDNIILMPDGQMKLIDFGAARSYVGDKSMTVVVKKGFAPVEQYLSKGSTAASDVYALAATIYYCITGKVPPDSAERQYDSAPLPSPSSLGVDITPQQDKALFHALQIQQKERTQSMQAFLDDLSHPKPVYPLPVTHDVKNTYIPDNRNTAGKKRIRIGAAAAVLLAVILIALLFLLRKDPGPEEIPTEASTAAETEAATETTVADWTEDTLETTAETTAPAETEPVIGHQGPNIESGIHDAVIVSPGHEDDSSEDDEEDEGSNFSTEPPHNVPVDTRPGNDSSPRPGSGSDSGHGGSDNSAPMDSGGFGGDGGSGGSGGPTGGDGGSVGDGGSGGSLSVYSHSRLQ